MVWRAHLHLPILHTHTPIALKTDEQPTTTTTATVKKVMNNNKANANTKWLKKIEHTIVQECLINLINACDNIMHINSLFSFYGPKCWISKISCYETWVISMFQRASLQSKASKAWFSGLPELLACSSCFHFFYIWLVCCLFTGHYNSFFLSWDYSSESDLID